MKTITLAFVIAMAAPVAAFAAEAPAKESCCAKMKEKGGCCCDKKDKDKPAETRADAKAAQN